MHTKSRLNVQILKREILEYLINNHPDGKNVYQIAAGVGETDDKGRQKVGRCCKKLEDDGYIYKENKRANYHITKKVYGYPALTAFSFGNQAIRTVCNIHRRLTNPPETALHQFATRIGALIEYIMIQALCPKKSTSR